MSTEHFDWPGPGETVVEWTPRAGLPLQQAWLSGAELDRMHRQASPLGQRWGAARCWVRARLALRLGCPPEQVPLRTDERGRLGLVGLTGTPTGAGTSAGGGTPRVAGTSAVGGPLAGIGTGDFNVSHTEHALVLAISGDRVGVDVEEPPAPADDPLALAEIVGTEQELAQLTRLPRAQRLMAFQRWWVRKEAVLKADGAGFLTDPRLVHVGVTEPQPPEPWTVLDHGALRHPDHVGLLPHTLLATAHNVSIGSAPAQVHVVSQPAGLRYHRRPVRRADGHRG